MASNETITFVTGQEPRISPGTYTLTVKQVLQIPDGQPGTLIQETYFNTKKVVVQGERFRIDPLAIDSVFPPDQGEGAYDCILPHVLLSRKTLLWERKSGVSEAPWLALLVFHANDPGGIPPIKPAMVGDLRRARLLNPPPNSKLEERDSTLNTSTATYIDAYKTWNLNHGEGIWDPCMVVDVPVPLFQDIAPAREDLKWLAHRRIVDDGDPKKNPREFSVIFANRLPQKAPLDGSSMSAAYLVSLEGMAAFLREKQLRPSIKVNGAEATHLRLVVLKAWSFKSQSVTKHGLANLKNGYGPLRLTYDDGKAATGNEVEAGKNVANALMMGYTAMDHTTRWGDRTISWYRGPFVPFNSEIPLVVAPPINHNGYAEGHAPICTADQALRYVPNLGMLDVSYAAAWQLGRLMALRDTTFSLALFHWKREIRQKTHAAAEGWALGLQSVVSLLENVLMREVGAATPGPTPNPADRAQAGENAGRPRHANKEWRAIVNSSEGLDKLHGETQAPEIIVNWLDKLRNLHGVPLDYLVPDERMLPYESLRYFQVDPNWIYSLIEGAFSVARDTSSDLAHDKALGRCVHCPGTAAYPRMSGFLLRSAAVSDSPGLQVHVDVKNSGRPALQFRRIAPDILLCLVEGIIEKVTFPEPPESIEFGLKAAGTTLTKNLRMANGAPAGTNPLPVSETVAGRRVLDINGLADGMAHEIKNSLEGKFPKFEEFNSAVFALQMLRS
jgi:hypothetical protein